MNTLLEPTVQEAPSIPQRLSVGPAVLAGDAGRIAAFLFDVDSLFDVNGFESAMARAVARAVAEKRQLDPLWLEVMAVEMARKEGGRRACEVVRALAGDDAVVLEPPASLFRSLQPLPGVVEALGAIHCRFKLAVVSSRSRIDTMRILRAIGLSDLFDAGAFNEEGASSTCRHATRLLEERADRCVVVGRVGSELLRAAGATGMRSVGLRSRDVGGARLSAVSGAELVVDSLELVAALADGATSVYDPAE